MLFKSKKNKGVTLLEVIISIAILALLVIPIASVVVQTSNTNKLAQDKQRAALGGQSILDQLTSSNNSAEDNADLKVNESVKLKFTDILGNNRGDEVSDDTDVVLKDGEEKEIKSGKYSTIVKIDSVLKNTDSSEIADQTEGEANIHNFSNEFENASLALEFVQTSGNTVQLFDPNSNLGQVGSIYSNDDDNIHYVLYIENNGDVLLYSLSYSLTKENLKDFDPSNNGTYVKVGQINPDGNHNIEMLLAGDKLVYNKSSYNGPSSFGTLTPLNVDLNIGFVSAYRDANNSNYTVNISRSENATGDLNLKTDLKVPGRISTNTYQIMGKGKNLADLYKVTVTVKNTKTNDILFQGSGTNNY